MITMRELVFKNLTSLDHRKRDLFVEETIEKNGILAKTTRRCLYFIKDRTRIKDSCDLKSIAELKVNNDNINRHFHVLKQRDTQAGVDKLMCKVAGTFYAIVNEYLYCIVFVHTFKIFFFTRKKPH